MGYAILDQDGHPFTDCLYMTLITITTIGYAEVIDMDGNPVGRIFTVLIALSGIGMLGYLIFSMTAFVVEGKISKSMEKKRMEKMLKTIKDHIVVCGIGRVGRHIVKELDSTGRTFVIVDNSIK